MSGYMTPGDRGDSESRNVADVYTGLSDVLARESNTPVEYYRVGSELNPISGDGLDAATTESFYTCHQCDNQESRLDLALNKILSSPRDALSVLLSDLFITERAISGTSFDKLRRPLRQIIQRGQTVAIFAIKGQFHGVIQDFIDDPFAKVRDATSRPLFVVLVGPRERVERAAMLFEQNVLFDSSKESHFILFSTRFARKPFSNTEGINWFYPAGHVEVLEPIGRGHSLPVVRLWPHGNVKYIIPVSRIVLPYALEPHASVDVSIWRKNAYATGCADAWQSINPFAGVASISQTNGAIALSFFSDNNSRHKLLTDETYLATAKIVGAERPPSLPAWTREWSFEDENAKALRSEHPAFFPARNFTRLAETLKDAVADNAHDETLGQLSVVIEMKE